MNKTDRRQNPKWWLHKTDKVKNLKYWQDSQDSEDSDVQTVFVLIYHLLKKKTFFAVMTFQKQLL